jgi:hypothetical protein
MHGPSLLEAHGRLFADEPRPLVSSSERDIVELRWPDGLTTHLALMPAAISTGEVEHAADASLAAFSAKFGPMPPHSAHVVVTTAGAPADVALLDTLQRHTRIVTAAAVAFGAIGVYEGNARATHPTPFYVNVATTSKRPLMLWTGVSIAREPNGRTSILTLGMENTVGVPDMLITAAPGAGNEALAFAFDMLAYVVDRGAPLPDGDTIGRSAEEKLRVTYVASPVDSTRRVVRIDLP